MKGIILAGGLGTRLHPITLSTCKQLLPIYDKPMIYYPLSTLMQAGISDIMIIATPEDLPRFETLLQDGSHLGISIEYAPQHTPNGIASAFLIAESFIGDNSVALILGDNIFHGHELSDFLTAEKNFSEGGIVFGYEVADPQRYGVLGFDEAGQTIDIIEKPKEPPSNYAVTGLYFYDNSVIEIAKSLKPSERGEYEITDINKAYLQKKELKVCFFSRGFVWLDTGTADAFHKASSYVQTIQERQGIKIGCLEEIAYQQNYIDLDQLLHLADIYKSSEYGAYLRKIAHEKPPALIT